MKIIQFIDAINENNPRVIDETRARKLASDLKGCSYYETCATYGLNVETVFQDGKYCYKKYSSILKKTNLVLFSFQHVIKLLNVKQLHFKSQSWVGAIYYIRCHKTVHKFSKRNMIKIC